MTDDAPRDPFASAPSDLESTTPLPRPAIPRPTPLRPSTLGSKPPTSQRTPTFTGESGAAPQSSPPTGPIGVVVPAPTGLAQPLPLFSTDAREADPFEDSPPTVPRPARADVTYDAPPAIPQMLSPLPMPPPRQPSPSSPPDVQPSSRRKSRRTVKMPDDTPPATRPLPAGAAPLPLPPPSSPESAEAAAAPMPVRAATPAAGIPAMSSQPPTIPRPPAVTPRMPPPPIAPAIAAPLQQADDHGEVIRPMRIISIGTEPPPAPAAVALPAPAPPPPAPPPPAPPPPKLVVNAVPDMDMGWGADDNARPPVSRPPMHAAPDLEEFVAPPPPPLPTKTAMITADMDELDAVEEVEPEAAITGERASLSEEPIEIEPEATPSSPRTRGDDIEEIEPERISDVDAAPASTEPPIEAEIAVDLDHAKPKKPPPPPPKRSTSVEPPSGALQARVDVTPATPMVSPLATPPAVPPPAAAITPPAPPVEAPPTPPPATAASTAPTQDPPARKRQKPWWDELFGDDFMRTLDRIEPKVIRKECDFIEDRLGLEKGAVMLDLACGPGSHAIELASRGYSVVGYDLSLAMLARAADEAQERQQKLNFLQGDMREMAFEETFDGIYCWQTSFGYFEDDKNLNVLSRVHRALRKGGLLLLDVINHDYVAPRQPSLVWFEGDGCVCMDEMAVDFFSSRLKVKRTVMFEDGRSKECDYSIRLYALHELGKMLHECGFKVVEVTGHPAHPGVFFGSESPRIIVLAERG